MLWDPGLLPLCVHWDLWTASPWVTLLPQPTGGSIYKQWLRKTMWDGQHVSTEAWHSMDVHTMWSPWAPELGHRRRQPWGLTDPSSPTGKTKEKVQIQQSPGLQIPRMHLSGNDGRDISNKRLKRIDKQNKAGLSQYEEICEEAQCKWSCCSNRNWPGSPKALQSLWHR